jgi:hypothetical protein
LDKPGIEDLPEKSLVLMRETISCALYFAPVESINVNDEVLDTGIPSGEP